MVKYPAHQNYLTIPRALLLFGGVHRSHVQPATVKADRQKEADALATEAEQLLAALCARLTPTH